MARLITNETPIAIPNEAELCLLLCSMFPKDFNIPIDDLVIYGMGLNLFKDVHHMIEGRHRVLYLIGIINDLNGITNDIRFHSLSIKLHRGEDEYDNLYVKMQVGAYDTLMSIISRYKLVVDREIIMKWPKKNKYEYLYGLLLVLRKISKYLVKLDCSNLVILQIQYGEDSKSLPMNFFAGMKELRVLSLDVPSPPQSLNVVQNLRNLRLKVLKLEDVSAIRGLINLEFLSIASVCLIDTPREIGQLHNLRSLDLTEMNIGYIPPGVFSRMLKLEELCLPMSFRRWGCGEKDEEYDDRYEWK